MTELRTEYGGASTRRSSSRLGRLSSDGGGRVLEVDDGFLSILGYPDRETFLLEVPRVQHLSGTPLPHAPGPREFLGDGSSERRWLCQSGNSVWVRIVARSEGEDRVLLEVEDVTSRQHLEAQLREAQKLALLGQLCAGMSHDLNNVLTAILARADLAASTAHDGNRDELASDLVEIRSAAERGSTMIRQMLNFGKGERLILQPTELREVVESALRLIRPILPPAVTLRVTRGKPCWVRADCGAIEQVLMNLVLNSRDAMPLGGRVRIDVREGSLSEESCARQGWGDPGRYGVITVTDTGPGMSRKLMEEAFIPFTSTKDPSQGTGLGLPTVYSLIKQHRGFITIVSEPGRGTTVRLHLRLTSRRLLATRTETIPGAAIAPDPLWAGASARILLVDDNEVLLSLAANILRSRGFQVETASDGTVALARLGNGEPPPAVMVTDLRMPGVTGLQLAEAVWRSGAPIQVLLTSGIEPDWGGRFAGQDPEDPRPPAPAFLPKPWSPGELLSAVTRLVELNGEPDSRRPDETNGAEPLGGEQT